MAEAAERIVFELSAKGAEQTKRAFDDTSTAIKKTDDRYQALAGSASKTASTISALGGAVGKISPEFNALGQAVGRASGAIQNMSAVLGGGLAGIAVGGVIAVIGIFAEKMAAAKKQAEELAKAERELAEATAEAAAEQLKSERALSAAAARRARDYGKTPEVLGLEAELEQAREDRSKVGVKHPVFGGFLIERQEEAVILDKKIADLEKRLERARAKPVEDAARKELESIAKRADAFEALADLEEQRDLEKFERRKRLAEEALEVEINTARFAVEELAKSDEKRFAEQAKIARQAEREETRALKKTEQERVEATQTFQNAGVEAMRMVGETGIQAFSALAKGEKVSARAILASIGDQMVAMGTYYLFDGIAKEITSYGLDPRGPGLIGLGVAEIAAGMALGAASAAGAPRGGGAAGGGAKYYIRNPDGTLTASAVEPVAAPTAGLGGSQTTNIVNMPTVTAPSKADGQRVQKALDAANRNGA